MLSNAIRAIFFDAVGTLIHPRPSAIEVYAAVGRRFGSRLEAAAIKARFRAAFRRQENDDREHGYRTDNEREVRRWRTIVAEVLDDVTDADACFQALFEHFARPDAWTCTPDAAPVLSELAGRGFRLGLASNFDKRLHALADALPELGSVRYRVISAEVGWRKPDARFFRKVCEVAGVTAGRILVVGDDFANDYEGAVAARMAAVLYDPVAGPRDGAMLRIGALTELPKLLPLAVNQDSYHESDRI